MNISSTSPEQWRKEATVSDLRLELSLSKTDESERPVITVRPLGSQGAWYVLGELLEPRLVKVPTPADLRDAWPYTPKLMRSFTVTDKTSSEPPSTSPELPVWIAPS
mgnify:CR=1 FL=1